MKKYDHWYDNPYNTSIAAGIVGIGFIITGLGLEDIVHKSLSQDLIFVGSAFGTLSAVGLCLGYLVDWENRS